MSQFKIWSWGIVLSLLLALLSNFSVAANTLKEEDCGKKFCLLNPGGIPDPNWGFYANYNGRFGLTGIHGATDFKSPKGNYTKFPVFAVFTGTITRYEQYNGGCGGVIDLALKSNPKIKVQYCHLNANSISHLSQGKNVTAGDKLGIADGSGSLSGGPHLHLKLMVNGKAVDLEPYLSNGKPKNKSGGKTETEGKTSDNTELKTWDLADQEYEILPFGLSYNSDTDLTEPNTIFSSVISPQIPKRATYPSALKATLNSNYRIKSSLILMLLSVSLFALLIRQIRLFGLLTLSFSFLLFALLVRSIKSELNIDYDMAYSPHQVVEFDPVALSYIDLQIDEEEREEADSEESYFSGECPELSKYPEKIQQWCNLIVKNANKNGLDPKLIAALILQESGGNQNAYSKSGAVGLMQVMPRDGLAASFSCSNGPCFTNRPTIKQLEDPKFNIKYGTNMLANLIKKRGSEREGLKYYGPADVGYYYANIVMSIYKNYR